jgi:hypothetical protein
MVASKSTTDILPQRLCSEIQLFDLCDLDSCRFKKGRFCTDTDLLGRFEKISEEDVKTPERFVVEAFDDAEADDADGYVEEDEFAMENYGDGDEDDYRDDE